MALSGTLPPPRTSTASEPSAAYGTGLWNPAGGLRYHLNAWRHRRSLWAPYTAEVARVLHDWAPAEPELVVVGPSAGWHLPAAFLQRFQVVWAIEPDPLARWLLRRRFPDVAWRMVTDDFFTPAGPLPWTDNLARLFTIFPDQALLFAHFLGQLVGLHPDAVAEEDAAGRLHETRMFRRWKAHFREHVAARTWASLHDRVSSPWPPALSQPLDLAHELPVADLARRCWQDGSAAIADHLTGDLAPELPRRLLAWPRKPGMHHVIEAVWQHRPPQGP